jgi:hypothetical protein
MVYCPRSGLLAFLVFVYWSSLLRLAPCPFSLHQCTFSFPTPSAVVVEYSSLFIVQVFGGSSVCPGAVLIYLGDDWGNSAWCMVLTCLVCKMSHRQVWSRWQQPSSFLSVMCCGEAFHGLGIQGVKGLILVGALLLPSVGPVSQWGLESELRLSASVPYRHLGSRHTNLWNRTKI